MIRVCCVQHSGWIGVGLEKKIVKAQDGNQSHRSLGLSGQGPFTQQKTRLNLRFLIPPSGHHQVSVKRLFPPCNVVLTSATVAVL